MKLFQAVLYTRNFRFECLAGSDAAARQYLATGLATHAHQYKLAANWYDDSEIQVREIEIGQTYRDQEKLPYPPGGPHLSDPDSPKGAK